MCQYTSIRAEVKEMYDYLCQLCFDQFHPTKLQVHHIIPRRDEGSNDPENLIPFCAHCHLAVHKNNITHNRYGTAVYMPKDIFLIPQLEEKVLALAA